MLSDWLPPLLLAPVIGSFLGVLVMRLPAGRPVALARSACDSCGATLQARDLVPLLSYAVLRGRCRRCHAPIGRFHLAIELACLLVAAVVVAVWSARSSAADIMPPDWSDTPAWSAAWIWSGCVLGWAALALAWIDWRCFRLPDLLTLPLLLLGLASCAALDPDALANHAAACLAGYLGFRAVALAYRRVRGRDGLGQGDAKLLAAGGAWVGLAALPSLVLLAAVATLATTLAVMLLRGGGRLRADLAVPFGPGLAVSSWALWLWITAVPVAISG